jgi:large subunit ribosomal protein L3
MDNQVINCRYEAQISSWMVKIGAFNHTAPTFHNIPHQQLQEFRRFMIAPKRVVMEFACSPDALVPSGTNLNATHFMPGQYVDVQGITKGKGFQGVMKRHGYAGQGASHGVSLTHRSGGSTGQSQVIFLYKINE